MTRVAGLIRADVRGILVVAAPLYLSALVTALGALINAAVLGRHGTLSLAALTLTSSVLLPAIAAAAGAVRGVVPFVAASRDDHDTVRRIAADGCWLALGTGAAGAAAVVSVPLWASAAGVPSETVDTLGYFPYLAALSMFLGAIASLGASLLVGWGRTTALVPAGVAGAVTTGTVSWVLVLGVGPVPSLGLAGSGGALVVAQGLVLLLTWRGVLAETGLRLGDLVRPPDLVQVLTLARIGLPLAGTVLVKFGALGVVALAAARLGSVEAAAHGALVALLGLVFTVAVAVGQAQVGVVAARAAHGSRGEVRRAVAAGLLLATALLLVLATVLLLSWAWVPEIFTGDAEVAALISVLVPVLVVVLVADGAQAGFGFGLAGLRRTVPSLLVFTASYGLLAVASFPVVDAYGLNGLWTAMLTANLALVVGQGLVFVWVSGRLDTQP